MLNTWTWVIWLVSALVIIWTTRNPFYLSLILISVILVWLSAENRVKKQYADSRSAVPFSPIRISIFIILLSALFNGLISHFGDTVFFHLPLWIPYIGGSVTLEALVFGAINGLVLSGILISFTVVNLSLPVRSLIRLIPQAFYPLAVVTSIAITFLPNTTRQLQQIREAQAIRGHQVRGIKDWLPLIMPLLIGGLERAMGLAETMTARGFAGGETGKNGSHYRLGFFLGLLFILAGWVMQLTSTLRIGGYLIAALGIMLIMVSLWSVGKRVQRSHYRLESWTYRDVIVIIGCVAIVSVFLLPIPWIDKSSIIYNPYPILTIPDFNLLIGLASIGLVIPALLKHPFDYELPN